MTGNRSLDEFGGANETDAEDGAPTAAETAADAPASPETASSDAAVEPIMETYAWSSAGAACGVCGETVTTRWRDDETLVCADCKAW